jgi:hypothetical protein
MWAMFEARCRTVLECTARVDPQAGHVRQQLNVSSTPAGHEDKHVNKVKQR